MVIDDFTKEETRWLSNFYPSGVRLDYLPYPTVEHAYQAAKSLDYWEREKIRTSRSAGVAKRLGGKVILRPDWESVKLPTMEALLRYKFYSGELRNKLIATGDAELIEGNYWGDTFWGVCKGKGENHLGKLLMKIREDIKGK